MPQRNTIITNMGFIGALLIVLLHVKPVPATVWENLIVDFVYNKSGFLGVAVPLFFGISGYLLAKHVNEDSWWKKSVKKRLKTLIVPFYVWTFILITVKFVLIGAAHICEIPVITPSPVPNGGKWFILEMVGLDVFHLTGIVWYMRSLFLMILISPFLVRVLKMGGVSSAILLAFLCVVDRYGPYSPFSNYWIDAFLANGLYCGGLLPFTIGIFIRIYPSVVEKFSCISLKLGGVIWGAFLCLSYFYDNIAIHYLIFMIDVLLIYGISKLVNFPSWIEGFSIRIYLSHMIIKWILAFIVNLIGVFATMWDSVLFWPIKYMIVITLTMFFVYKARRLSPKLSFFLFGGRK